MNANKWRVLLLGMVFAVVATTGLGVMLGDGGVVLGAIASYVGGLAAGAKLWRR